MTGIRSMFGDLPMRGIWFAPYGTPCPRNAWEPLGPEWSTDLPRERDNDVHGFQFRDPYRIMPPDRFARMSVVFDAGTGVERARLLLPQVQVVQDCNGPEAGVVAKWMVTAPRLRRFMREREQTLNGDDSRTRYTRPTGVGGGGGGAATVNAVAPSPAAMLAEAACLARASGMGTGDIIDQVTDALKRHGQEEKRAQARAAFHRYLTNEIGEVVRAGLIDELSVGLVEQAQRLADEGVLLVRDR